MGRYHRRARRDANHAAIEAVFLQLGCSFIDVSQTPCGFDGLVGYGGLTMPIEIKNPEAENWKKRSKKNRTVEQLLTKNEKDIHARWTGGKRLVMSIDDVVETVKTLRKWHAAICRDTSKSTASKQLEA